MPLRPPSPTLDFARAGGPPSPLGVPPRPFRHWGRLDCPRLPSLRTAAGLPDRRCCQGRDHGDACHQAH
ncbi:hypothetical protein DMA10_28395 [Streptomyces sp. WAC 01420]|nr:hypothetical protein DLM49_26325 [Streptomyces sp. WAC 01438]RSM90933.1 hypothetical protein DMA10_28395 [Streptomyces sp. WAC 01420]